MAFRYYPTVSTRGYAGSKAWRHKGEWWPTGRRRIPIYEVSRLWLQGMTVKNICAVLGRSKKSQFQVSAVERVIWYQRKYGDPALFPFRRSADDGELDYGIDKRTALSLGL
jgi:hypothetical protein